MPRFFVPLTLHAGELLSLPAAAARHVQVLRFQPGHVLTLFNGEGGEYAATVERMGKNDVTVKVGAHAALEREAARAVHLAVGMPANERFDWLIEKATELGAASIQPLMTERSVLKVTGDRAEKKLAHWQAQAQAACEQCGRNRVPRIAAAMQLQDWLKTAPIPGARLLLSLHPDSRSLGELTQAASAVTVLSGPEGGLSPTEEQSALAQGFSPASLGARVLRAETAAIACTAALILGPLDPPRFP
jgi:16S rRNA (uracil1498-N3)-methyltransferase